MKIEKKVANEYFHIRRRFEDSVFVYRLYAVWTAVAFVAIVFFGLYPLGKNILEKRKLIYDLTQINTALAGNIQKSEELKSKVLGDYKLIKYIDVYLPPTYDIDEYAGQLSQVVSQSGFLLMSISVSEIKGSSGLNAAQISGRIIGPGNFPLLIKNIESLKRITFIESIRYTRNTHSSVAMDSTVGAALTIYNLPD